MRCWSRRSVHWRLAAPDRSAFTLIEILIASVLVAALMSVIWGMMSMYNTYLTAGMRRAEEQQLIRSLWQILAADLQNVAVSDSVAPSVAPVVAAAPSSELLSADPIALPVSDPMPVADVFPGMEPFPVTEFQVDPAPVDLSGTADSLRLSMRRAVSQWTGDARSEPTPDGLESGAEQEGRAPDVPDFQTVIYQFQAPGFGGAGDAGTPTSSALASGLYRIEVASLPLALLMSQESTLLEAQQPENETRLEPNVLQTLIAGAANQDQNQSETERESAAADTGWPLVRMEHLPEIVACRFQYFDGRSWHSEWNGGKGTRLPVAVRIRIQTASLEDLERLASDPSRLPSEALSEEADVASTALISGERPLDNAAGPDAIPTRVAERIILLQPVKPRISLPGDAQL